MKNITLIVIICCLFINPSLFSQVGIGTNAPDSSAILELESTQKGFLPSRMTTEQRDSIQNPAIGLVIYNLDCHCINFFNGDQWVEYGRDPVESFNCGQVLTDARTGRSYNTILIGSQCWMAENLDVGEMINNTDLSSDNGILEKYCYGNAPGNCSKLGALYRWDELMQYDTNRYNQGICPEGWHLPNTDEWDTLVNHYGGQSLAGASLKEEGVSGFEALLAGGMKYEGSFYGKGSRGYFWSSTASGSSSGWAYNLNDGSDLFNKVDTVKQNAYPVRCIKGYPNRVDTGVVVIDTTVYTLISDSAELAQGIYKYTFGQRKRDDIIVNGNIIVGTTGDGYLRKVISQSQDRGQLTLLTDKADLEDLFVYAEFLFPIVFTNMTGFNMMSHLEGISINNLDDGFELSLQDVVLFQNSSCTFTANGTLRFDPDFNNKFILKERNLNKFETALFTSSFNSDLDLNFSVNNAFSIEDQIITIAKYSKRVYKNVGLIPFGGKITITLKAKYSLSFDAPLELSTGFTSNNTITFGANLQNGNWKPIWEPESDNSLHPLNFEMPEFTVTQKLEIIPEINIKFMDLAGPFFNINGYEELEYAIATESLDWNSNINVGLKSYIGITAFDLSAWDFGTLTDKEIFAADTTLWEAPSSLEIFSGNNQTGVLGQQLPDPIIVKVEDSRGETFANIPVHFAVTSGGGTVQSASVMTDADGYAQTTWTLGSTGSQQVSASVLKANGENITGSPVTFTANIPGSSGCGSITVNHVAGNVAPVNKTVTYNTVTGVPGEPAKCWITSNLGADHQATSVDDATEESAGWYWQFNRMQGYKHDGTTRTPSISWYNIDENSNWITINDPCNIELGSNWRLPTLTEYSNIIDVGGWTNWNGPWNSSLKIHAAGWLHVADGGLSNRGYPRSLLEQYPN